MPGNSKDAPEWTEGMSYEDYKKEIEVWQLLKVATDIEEGPLVFRSLPPKSKAKAAASELSVAEIGAADGLKKILVKLDQVYLAEQNQRIFIDLEAFEKFNRKSTMSMADYVLEFERLHVKVRKHKCEYPDGVLAYKLLERAKMSYDDEKLCLATIATNQWSYKSMKEQIKKISNNIVPTVSESCDNKAIKVEPTLYARSSNVHRNDICDDFTDVEADAEYSDEDLNRQRNHRHRNRSSDVEENDVYYGKYNGSYNRGNRYGKPSFQRSSNFNRGNRSNSQQYHQGRRYVDVDVKKLSDSYDPSPNVPNPKDNRGNYTSCRKCRSIYHWMKDCPHAAGQDNNTSSGSKVFYGDDSTGEVYISLFQTSIPATTDEVLCLVGETLNMAVIDSGCPRTVCGSKWYATYLDSMSDEQKSKLQSESSNAVFRFGDSSPITSKEKVYLPVTIKDKNLYLPTEVVNADVPLLLSKEALKKGKAVTDFQRETIQIYDSEQPMICTSSGHYAIPIKPHSTELTPNIVMHIVTDSVNKKTAAKKLHHQFGHPSTKKLVKFVKDSGEDNEELIKELEDVRSNCDTCKRYKPTPPRPVVTFPLATEFNQTVGMDLKIYKNNAIYFLHLVDHATRFSAACVIRSKKAAVIITAIFTIWIAVFGCPQTILSDNGGEFANQDFMDMCHNLSINFITTAAESPWSNGLVEKHNELIGDAVFKIMEDVKCSVEIALCWAVNAKNSLQNIHGFSPYQLTFGRTPKLPSAFTDKLPALEGVTHSQLIADQLNALHKARQEFIKLESSEKLRRALKARTRTHNNIRYFQGENVFYKREDEKRWLGPGKVIGQDGSKVLIKIPTGHISVHSSRVILTSEAEQNRRVQENADSDSNETSISEHVEVPPTAGEKLWNKYPEIDVESNEIVEITTQQQNEELEEVNTPVVEPADNNAIENLQLDGGQIEDIPERKSSVTSTRDLPKNNQCVEFKTNDSEDWKRCLILSRAGKASGVNKFWINVRNIDDNTEECIDWKNDIQEWKVSNNNVFLATGRDFGYEAAKETELNNWKKMNVYEVVEDHGQSFVTVRWVTSEKITADGKKVKKARLVARGYEEDLQGIATDSPTINKESLRLAYMIIAGKEWEIQSLDIKAAFLQGKPISREVYLKPPREAKMKGKLWKLKQCVYGLDDASRKFYLKVKEELLKLGCEVSRLDPAVFSYHTNNGLQGLLMSHVDDFLWSGDEIFKTSVIDKIRGIFKISSENSTLFKYVGLDIQQCEDGIYVSQNKYAGEIDEIDISESRLSNPNQPINEEEKSSLRSVIGQLNWLATQTRPDLAYDVCDLSTSLKDGSVSLLTQANRIVKKSKLQDVYLHYPKMNLEQLSVNCFADASFGNLKDGGSQGGVYTEVMSGTYSCPVEWQSKRIRRSAKSTLAAETIALVEAIDTAIYLKELISEILYSKSLNIPINCFTDNLSLFQSANSTTSVSDRRLRIELAVIREAVAKKEVTLTWVQSKDQLADCLTKKGCDSKKLLDRITEKHQ